MSRDDIINMARAAGFRIDGNEVTESDGYLIQTELLTDFAELAAAAHLLGGPWHEAERLGCR